jgi:3-hydroxyisobutyrate dehydrogenase-like beta-hydroxyacid dehydrogenase
MKQAEGVAAAPGTLDQLVVGLIGTGRMGSAMAGRLIAAGYDVAVYNRTRVKAQPLADRGAVVVEAVSELADRDFVFTMVSASADLEEVTLGADGLLRQAAAPRVLVDSSTVSQETSAKVRGVAAERGTALLAAPVSGNPKVVASGRLTIVASGPKEAYDEAAPLLAALGRGSTYVGEGEVARLVKVAHNVFLAVVVQSLIEIIALAQKAGVSRAALLEFLNDSVLGSMFTRYKSPALVNLDFTPTFTTTLLRKDLDLGLAAAQSLGLPMPLAAVTHELVQAAIGAGHGESDFAALLVEQARASGLELRPENVTVDDGLGS